MQTTHKVIFENSSNLKSIEDKTIDLMITSPPYPMIEMWDDMFSGQDSRIREALENNNGNLAFELMHKILDKVWTEAYRVLKEGGIACINIGDATRSIDGNFQIFMNNARIINACTDIGFLALPCILWRKQTNAPDKFMGAGTLPVNGYVTQEHEFILIFKKGLKREFKSAQDKLLRQQSAFFFEERNTWFSDFWDFKGVLQKMASKNGRGRSAAFPFELPYRLINMYSVKGDVVLDPFLGTGTTILAAIASQRNSIGYEIDTNLREVIDDNIMGNAGFINGYSEDRFNRHVELVKGKEDIKYVNGYYNVPVTSAPEKNIILPCVCGIQRGMDDEYKVTHSDYKPNIE